MIRIKITLACFFVSLFLFFSVSCASSGDNGETSLPPPRLTIINKSAFEILELYIHSNEGNYKETENLIPAHLKKEKMEPSNAIYLKKEYEGEWYVTFIRIISSTSAGKIAITTGYPISLKRGYHLVLNLLEDDFSFKQTEILGNDDFIENDSDEL